MQRREQYLLGGLLAAAFVFGTYQWAYSIVFGPFESRQQDLARIQKAVADKSDRMLQLARETKRLNDWKLISLPPDDTAKSKQPSALDAQRLYVQWLTDLSQICGFESLKVSPNGESPKGKIYIAVTVRIEAEARYEQLVRFLDLFYRTQLLHRVSAMQVSTRGVFEGDPPLSISLDAEGLAMLDAPPRRTLFPQTKIAESISAEDTFISVTDPTDFPKSGEFRIQIKNEFLQVKAIEGTEWQVERGIEKTIPSAHAEQTTVELVKLVPNQSVRTIDEIREMISANIFTKPAPPYKMRVVPGAERTVAHGKSLEFSINISGYDAALGKPEFQLTGEPPAGIKLDRTGKVTWKPADDLPSGKYELNFDVIHPSATNGRLPGSVAIRVRDPRPSPKLNTPVRPTVYLNRSWKYQPQLEGADVSPTTLTWKLGERPPEGITINSRTGELNWTPGDAVALGELTIPISISDSETPPQTSNLPLKVEVRDDAAQFTRLTGIFVVGNNKRAFLTDQSIDKSTEVREGDSVAIADITARIKEISSRHIVVDAGQQTIRWEIGLSLREAEAAVKGK